MIEPALIPVAVSQALKESLSDPSVSTNLPLPV